MALGWTQLLTEMSTRFISCWGKDCRCVGLTTFPPSCGDCVEILGTLTSWDLMVCPGLYSDCFTFYCYINLPCASPKKLCVIRVTWDSLSCANCVQCRASGRWTLASTLLRRLFSVIVNSVCVVLSLIRRG